MLEKLKNKLENKKIKKLFGMLGAFALVLSVMTVGAFADGGTLTAPTIDDSLFTFILSTLSGYIAQILPFGLKVMGLMIAVGFIPRLIYKFV